jgi:hypothetical protein
MVEPSPSLEICPVCGGDRFTNKPVLWPELIEQWELSPDEVAYIDWQQGFCCVDCKNSLRTMTLAAAATRAFGFAGSFKDFCRNDPAIRQLTVIEINPAKNLSPFLQTLPKHALHSFPELDMQQMSLEDSSVDIIIHSDTLEHGARIDLGWGCSTGPQKPRLVRPARASRCATPAPSWSWPKRT